MSLIKTLREKIFGEAEDDASESFQEKSIIIFLGTASGIMGAIVLLLCWTFLYPKLALINEAKQQLESQLRQAIKDHEESGKSITILPQVTREAETITQTTLQKLKIKPVEGILESERVLRRNMDDDENNNDSSDESPVDPVKQDENKEEKKIF